MDRANSPIRGALEFTIREVTEEQVVADMSVISESLNPFGVVNAGAIVWFADVCATVLVAGTPDIVPGDAGFPLGVNLNAALVGNQRAGTLTATARFVKRGRRFSVVRTAVTGAGGRPIAEVTTSHLVSTA